MAKTIRLDSLSKDEREVLRDSIPLLRDKAGYYWDKPEVAQAYKKWLEVTKGRYTEGGYEQFFLMVYKMKQASINLYTMKEENQDYLRKVMHGEIIC